MADCLDKDFYESLEAAQPRVEELPPKPKAGVPYIGEIARIYSGETKKGNACINVEFDIHDGESAGYFQADLENRSQSFGADNWNYDAVQTYLKENNYQMKLFKGLIENIEKSNAGFSFADSNYDIESLADKIVGIAFKDRKYVDKNGNDAYALTIARTYPISEIKNGTANLPKSTKPPEDDMIDHSTGGSEPDIPF
mgnify:CR=1 FL=1